MRAFSKKNEHGGREPCEFGFFRAEFSRKKALIINFIIADAVEET
jgi:hypothetical protein